MRYLRSCALALLVLPAAPLGGVVPVPTVGGKAFANGGECKQFDEASGYWRPPPDDIGTPTPLELNDTICPALDGAVTGALAGEL